MYYVIIKFHVMEGNLSDSERIKHSVESMDSKIYASKKLSDFFEITVTLKVFGHVVKIWSFPPNK